jgi:hypothetical protein
MVQKQILFISAASNGARHQSSSGSKMVRPSMISGLGSSSSFALSRQWRVRTWLVPTTAIQGRTCCPVQKSSIGENTSFNPKAANLFATLFGSRAPLDVRFIREDQEQELLGKPTSEFP